MLYFTHVDGREQITKKHLAPGYHVSFSFEVFSGADLILTPMKGNISQSSIQDHLNAGAVMIQIKHSRDLSASIVDQRLFESLQRMTVFEAEAYQCGLLVTGDFQVQGRNLFIDGQKSNVSSDSYMGALNSWIIRGGAIYPQIKAENIQRFIDLLGAKLYSGDPFYKRPTARKRKKYKEAKEFSKGMGLRQRATISRGSKSSDLRSVLINIDGLSNDHITEIWKLMSERSVEHDMGGFLTLLLGDCFLDVKGVGKKTNQKIKEQLGYGK